MSQRPLASVPPAVMLLLVAALAGQLAWHLVGAARARGRPPAALGPPPALAVLRMASLGEPVALAKLLMFHVQAADAGGDGTPSYGTLDYGNLALWLGRVSDLDPRAEYPLIAASHLYAEVNDPARKRRMLDFVYQRFLADPNRRWRALAHVTMVAKHQLHDLPLALVYARALRRLATGPKVPPWARQMEVFVLEDMGEVESAKILLGGMLASGELSDPHERRMLEARLNALVKSPPSR